MVPNASSKKSRLATIPTIPQTTKKGFAYMAPYDMAKSDVK
jgi:hypothetical protein